MIQQLVKVNKKVKKWKNFSSAFNSSHSSSLDWKAEPEHLPLQLDPGLLGCENPVSPESGTASPTKHTEHCGPTRLCARPTAVCSAHSQSHHQGHRWYSLDPSHQPEHRGYAAANTSEESLGFTWLGTSPGSKSKKAPSTTPILTTFYR